MKPCFNKTSGYVFGLESKPHSNFPLLAGEQSRQDEWIGNVDNRFELSRELTFFAREERSGTRKGQTFVATGSVW